MTRRTNILFDGDYFQVPNLLIDRWTWTRCQPIDFLIFSSLLRHVYSRTDVLRKQKGLAAQLGIKRRHLIDRLKVMEEKGMMKVLRNPGKVSTIDLNPIKAYLRDLKPSVEKLPFDSTGGAPQCTPTCAPQCTPPPGGNGTKGPLFQADTETECGPNKTDLNKTRSDTRQGAVESSRKPAGLRDARNRPVSTSNPGPDFAVREWGPLLEDPRAPEEIRERRRNLVESHPNKRRQVIETLVRLELRIFGIRSSLINDWFTRIPLDGMLWWINEAFAKARRNPGGFVATMLDRTGGEYPGRQVVA